MTCRAVCPACGHPKAERVVATYEYTHGPIREDCRQTDTFYCGRCGHAWEQQHHDTAIHTTAWHGASAVVAG